MFQRLIRGWDKVHPYNAVQVAEICRPVDPGAASATWSQTLRQMQLGKVVVRPISYRHVGLNGEMSRYDVRVLPADVSLEDFIGAEMNRPFDDPSEPPFRPFIQADPSGRSWRVGVVYQHWVADSVAVRHLIRRWLELMFVPTDRHSRDQIRHADIGYLGLLDLAPTGATPIHTLFSSFRRQQRYRRARKVATFGRDDYPVRVLLQSRANVVPQLLEAARRSGVKVNDLFLAAAARACARRIPVQRRRFRNDVAVASIVDLRPLARGALHDRFGLFLGFAEVVCRPQELARPVQLLQAVARQNRGHRDVGIWPSSVCWLLAAWLASPLVKPEKLYHFFRKEAPLLAGVSNVNLTNTWVGDHDDLVVKYRRISPTGPLAPVVFALTTLGNDLELSLTYRQALLSRESAISMIDDFFSELDVLSRA